MCCRLASPNHQGVKNAVFLIEASSVLPADPHHRLPRQSQDQRRLSGGGREARESSQQHHAGRLRSAWQDGPCWRRKEAVRNGKRKKEQAPRSGTAACRLSRTISIQRRFSTEAEIESEAVGIPRASPPRMRFLHEWKLDGSLMCVPLLLCSSSSRCSTLSAA